MFFFNSTVAPPRRGVGRLPHEGIGCILAALKIAAHLSSPETQVYRQCFENKAQRTTTNSMWNGAPIRYARSIRAEVKAISPQDAAQDIVNRSNVLEKRAADLEATYHAMARKTCHLPQSFSC